MPLRKNNIKRLMVKIVSNFILSDNHLYLTNLGIFRYEIEEVF